MFMSLMTPTSVAELVEASRDAWRAALPGWRERGRVVLFDEAQRILCRSACAWAGVPLREPRPCRGRPA